MGSLRHFFPIPAPCPLSLNDATFAWVGKSRTQARARGRRGLRGVVRARAQQGQGQPGEQLRSSASSEAAESPPETPLPARQPSVQGDR